MSLFDKIKKHAGKLIISGVLTTSFGLGVVYHYSQRENQVENHPKVARVYEIQEELSGIEQQLNKQITLNDAIILLDQNNPERDKYFTVSQQQKQLTEEYNSLVKDFEVQELLRERERYSSSCVTWAFLTAFLASLPLYTGLIGFFDRRF